MKIMRKSLQPKGEFYIFDEIPESLQEAILYFMVSIVVKKHRNIKDFNTMLIHTSHLTSKIDYLKIKLMYSFLII